MLFLFAHTQHSAYRQGMRDFLTMSPGIAAWGLMTGVATANSGLGPIESYAMAVLMFAGSSQLAAIPLLSAGAPIWVILLTAFCVNLRFVVFSAHLRPYLMVLPYGQRLLAGFLTADVSYVQLVHRYPEAAQAHDPAGQTERVAYLAGNDTVNWLVWVGSGVLGIALASQIPTHWALGFAGLLALVGLSCNMVKDRMQALSAGLAGAIAVAAMALPFKLNLVVGIALAMVLCLGMEAAVNQRRKTP